MRISLSHDPIRKGLLFKTTYQQVSVTVLFTHEELQIIRQRGFPGFGRLAEAIQASVA